MQFFKGGELFEHLTRIGTFSEQQVKYWAVQIGSALGYLHSKNYVYRDLKPENLLLDQAGDISICDFGMAKFIKKSKAKSVIGTPEYVSPEVLGGKPYGYTTDWWSFGTLLLILLPFVYFYRYEMLYGIPPFYDEN